MRSMVEKLETQLVSLFGSPSRSTGASSSRSSNCASPLNLSAYSAARRLPSPGLADKFVVRVQPRATAVGSEDREEVRIGSGSLTAAD